MFILLCDDYTRTHHPLIATLTVQIYLVDKYIRNRSIVVFNKFSSIIVLKLMKISK